MRSPLSDLMKGKSYKGREMIADIAWILWVGEEISFRERLGSDCGEEIELKGRLMLEKRESRWSFGIDEFELNKYNNLKSIYI